MADCLLSDEELQAAVAAHRADNPPVFSRRMVISIADMAGMKPMSMVWKLEKMGLLKRGSWEWFRNNGGITYEHVVECRADRLEGKGNV